MQLNNCARTYDTAYIKSVLTHPTIWPNISDGADIKPEDYEPPMDEENIYLRVPGGLFILHPFEDGLMIHANMVERGDVATRGVNAAMDWALAHGAKKLYAEIPNEFPNVRAFAERSGFYEYKVFDDMHYFIKELG